MPWLTDQGPDSLQRRRPVFQEAAPRRSPSDNLQALRLPSSEQWAEGAGARGDDATDPQEHSLPEDLQSRLAPEGPAGGARGWLTVPHAPLGCCYLCPPPAENIRVHQTWPRVSISDQAPGLMPDFGGTEHAQGCQPAVSITSGLLRKIPLAKYLTAKPNSLLPPLVSRLLFVCLSLSRTWGWPGANPCQ